MEELLELLIKNWQFLNQIHERLPKRNQNTLYDSRKPWTILNVRKTDSNDCDYKYWVWRPPSDIPRCRVLKGRPCTEEDCPQKLGKEEVMFKKFNYPITDPDNTFLIRHVSNGFVLTRFSDIEGYYEPVQILHEFKNESQTEPDFDCVANFLWDLLEVLEIYNSKHFKKRINIEVVDQED